MSVPRTRKRMQEKVWAIVAQAKKEGCGYLACPSRSLRFDHRLLRRLVKAAIGKPTLFVLSHLEERIYRVFVSDLADRDLPTDLLEALATYDPKRAAVLAVDTPHEVEGHPTKVHFAKVLHLGRDGLVQRPLAIFPE